MKAILVLINRNGHGDADGHALGRRGGEAGQDEDRLLAVIGADDAMIDGFVFKDVLRAATAINVAGAAANAAAAAERPAQHVAFLEALAAFAFVRVAPRARRAPVGPRARRRRAQRGVP